MTKPELEIVLNIQLKEHEIAYIEKQTLCFVNHDADFYCARGEIKKKGK